MQMFCKNTAFDFRGGMSLPVESGLLSAGTHVTRWYAHVTSRYADGISRYSVPASAGSLLPLVIVFCARKVPYCPFSVGED